MGRLDETLSPYRVDGQAVRWVSSHKDLGVTVDESLKFHDHITTIVRVANGMTSNLLSSTLARDAEFVLNIYTMHVRPILEYGSSVWNTGYLGDLHALECVQRRWTRAVEGLENEDYAQRLKRLGLFSLQGRLRRADLILTYKIFHNLCSLKPDSLFQLPVDHRTRGHKFKIHTPRTHIDARKRFFAVRVVRDWNDLKHDTVDAPSVNVFKQLLHRDMGEKLFEFS